MSVVDPQPGGMLLDRATIARMDADDLRTIMAAACGHGPDRADAQRTMRRGLDQGVFGLDRHLEVRLASKLRDAEWTGEAEASPGSGTENERMNVRALLTHEPRLGDNPSLMKQPSIETIVRMHFDRMFGEGQGAIIADRYLESIREAAASSAAADGKPEVSTVDAVDQAAKDGPIDPSFAKAFVANLVREAVISERKPQTRLQIVRLVADRVRDGSIFEKAPDLCRHFSQGGLLGDQEEIVSYVALLISEDVLTPFADGFVAKPTANTDDAGRAEREPAKPKPTRTQSETAGPATSKPEPTKAPAFSLGTLLSDIGLDVKVGSMDVVSSVEKAARTGDVAPLMAGIAGVLMTAVANAGSKKAE